ncbi:MobA-like NTP transferase domain protein [compost metagenome]
MHHDERGHPVLFGRDFWPELLRLTGDEGARRVMRAHASAWVAVGVDDPGVLRDVDWAARLASTH